MSRKDKLQVSDNLTSCEAAIEGSDPSRHTDSMFAAAEFSKLATMDKAVIVYDKSQVSVNKE